MPGNKTFPTVEYIKIGKENLHFLFNTGAFKKNVLDYIFGSFQEKMVYHILSYIIFENIIKLCVQK